MSQLIDQVAREIAQDMPRRRAIRIFVGAAAGVAFGATRVPNAQAIICPPPEFHCDCPNKDLFYRWCCSPNQDCKCIAPPNGGAYCVCKDELKCGSACCPVGGTCADPDIELCCKPKATACKGSSTVTCCKAGAACCDGHCCRAGKRCVDGKCEKCPPKTRVCGNEHCCKAKEACCGGKCCKPGETCASAGPNRPTICCPPQRVLRTRGGVACCPPGKVARNGACCPTSGPCDTCEDVPCLPGTYCVNGSCFALK